MDLVEIDLIRLIGRNTLIIPCTISTNGLGIKSSSLINTRANGYAFINIKFVKLIERFLGIEL
jgi:hypothetical protein